MVGLLKDNNAIAFGQIYVLIVLFVACFIWIILGLMVDSLDEVFISVSATEGRYSDGLMDRFPEIVNTWGYALFLFVSAGLIYIIKRAMEQPREY